MIEISELQVVALYLIGAWCLYWLVFKRGGVE